LSETKDGEFLKNSSFVIGRDGLIGGALAQFLSRKGYPFVATTRRRDVASQACIYLDLDSIPHNWDPPFEFKVAYFCAAISSYEECRRNPHSSRLVNVINTVKTVGRLVDRNVFVVYPSTNAVFDGSLPYRKTNDPTSPQTEYGRQKAEVEAQLLQLGEQVCIVRLSKVFSRTPPLLMEWISRLQHGEPIHPFCDLTCAPLFVDEVAKVLVSIAMKRLPGIWHLSGERDITYAELADHLASRLHLDSGLVQPVSVRNSPFHVEHAPAYTSLDCSRLIAELGIELPPVWQTIDSIVPV